MQTNVGAPTAYAICELCKGEIDHHRQDPEVRDVRADDQEARLKAGKMA
jgi:hypothetical protein